MEAGGGSAGAASEVHRPFSCSSGLRTTVTTRDSSGSFSRKEGAPLIRYRTHDLTRIIPDDVPCPCGRKLPRIDVILGRTDDMVKVHGVNMVTSKLLGCFLEDERSRKEVMSLMGY